MRILEGKHAGRWLTSPGGDVRPTPETARARAKLARGALASFLPNLGL
jgi:hypothetical protein